MPPSYLEPVNMDIRLEHAELRLLPLRTRFPFKYGIATMTEMPLAFFLATFTLHGQPVAGIASDVLPPKWFTKNPDEPFEEELRGMIRSIRQAAEFARDLQAGDPFGFWLQLHQRQSDWSIMQSVPALLAQFGTSIVERALLSAVARFATRPFHSLLHDGTLGIDLSAIHPELAGRSPADFLPAAPPPTVIARHTVGLGDPLRDSEIVTPVADGLPESLESAITRYHLRHFKIKVAGRPEFDRARLRQIAEVLAAKALSDWAVSIDGNEQFHSFAEWMDFWNGVAPECPALIERLLFVEQPCHRSVALDAATASDLAVWQDHPPFIIDESDAELRSLPRALELGYSGTSHKNCKGVFKGIANRCLIEFRRRTHPGNRFLMSGEDLCNVGPVALLQDLAVMSALGIDSVERNGHHYVAGLSAFPRSMQTGVLARHGDLYEPSPHGWPTLAIRNGALHFPSVVQSCFGTNEAYDLSGFSLAFEIP